MLKKRMLKICAVMLGAMLVVTGTVSGKEMAQAVGKTKTQDIESMVVTAGRIKEKKEDVTTNITVYNQEDLEKLSVSDLSDLMIKEGFMIREYPNSTISVGIRGSEPRPMATIYPAMCCFSLTAAGPAPATWPKYPWTMWSR